MYRTVEARESGQLKALVPQKVRESKLASLCTGYGGLDMAAMAVFGGKLAWCADNDKHVATILEARYPGVPNLGDLTVLDWSQAPPVDIICAGFPCQDISSSGKGFGIEKGERSGIWKNIVEGIRVLRPQLIFVENVSAIRGRGLSRVLGDLAKRGYESIWTSLRASEVGAPHRRERVFILGYTKEPKATDLLTTAHTLCQREPWWPDSGQTYSPRPSGTTLGCCNHPLPGEQAGALRTPPNPTGQQRDQGLTQTAEQQRQSVPTLSNDQAGHSYASGWSRTRAVSSSSVGDIRWGRYELAIRRWERLTGRPAPHPVEPGTKGQLRLSPVFSEWLMGLPIGFVTDLGLPYSAQHRAIGNGVVPQQAVRALVELVTLAVEGSALASDAPTFLSHSRLGQLAILNGEHDLWNNNHTTKEESKH